MTNKLEQLEEKDLSLPEDAKEVLKRFLIFCACPGHAVDGAIEIIDKSIKLTRLQTQEQAILNERQRIIELITKYDLIPPQVKMESPRYWKGYEDTVNIILEKLTQRIYEKNKYD